MPITRTASGFVFSDDTTRADSTNLGGDWIERSGDWEIVSNEFNITSTAVDTVEHGADPGGEMFVQATFGGTSQGTLNNHGLWARYEWNDGSSSGYLLVINALFSTLRLNEYSAGVVSVLQSDGFSTAANPTAQLYTADGVQHGRWRGAAGWVSRTATNTVHNAANARTFAHRAESAFGESVTKTSTDWLRCTSKFITVTDTNGASNWRARIIGPGDVAVLTIEATAGAATLDVMDITALNGGVPLAGFDALVIETGAGASWTETERYDTTGVYPGDSYEFAGETPPDTPTLTNAEPGSDSVVLTSSAFATTRTGGDTHESSSWQVTTDADTTFAAPVAELLASEFLTSAVLEGLSPSTDYRARVLHVGEFGGGSPYSAAVTFSTLAEAAVPATPTVTVDEVGDDFVRASMSAFSHPDAGADPEPFLVATQWQVRFAAGATVYDSGVTADYNLDLAILVPDLAAATAYEIRARNQEGFSGLFSAYSAWVAFSTDAVPVVRPAQPTVDPLVCTMGAVAATSSAYSHPEASAHTATQWRLTITDALNASVSSQILEQASASTAISIDELDAGDVQFEVRYADTEGRWSLWSAPVSCTVLGVAGEINITAPRSGRVVSANQTITWETLQPDSILWDYELSVSADNGATWSAAETVSEPAATTWDFVATGRPNGIYYVRIRACYPDGEGCGPYVYLVLVIDRTSIATQFYDFSQYESLPATWSVKWDTEGVTWSLVDEDLGVTGPTLGILAKTNEALARKRSALVFEELGEPVEGDFVASFVFLPNNTSWVGWRGAFSQFMAAGITYRANGATGISDYQGLQVTASPGSGESWPVASCGCGFHPPEVCAAGPALRALYNWANPGRLFRYGVPGLEGGLVTVGFRNVPDFFITQTTQLVPRIGDRSRGASMSTLREDEGVEAGSSCKRTLPVYTLRVEVRRTTEGIRIRQKLVGPGVDVSVPWHAERTIALLEAQTDCGFCGLGFFHAQSNLAPPEGMLFTSFSASNLVYGECEGALAGCVEGWRYTDFRDDDITPVYGVGDGMGGVIEADYYTNKECPRPFLKIPQDFSDTDIDFPAGATTIGAITVEIVDKRLTAADQDTGIVTAEMERRQGRRGLLERWRDDRGWVTVFDGIVYESEVDDRLVTIRRHLRDPRERERRVSLFARNETFSLWPQIGPIDPYAERPDGTHLIDGTLVATGGTFAFEVEGDDSIIRPYYFGYITIDGGAGAVLQQQGYSSYSPDGTEIGTLYPYLFQGVTVRWRDAPGDPWTYVRDMRIEFFAPMFELPAGGFGIYLASDDLADLPAAGGVGFVQILAARTTEDTPFFWDRGSFGDLLLEIYEGDHTLRPPKIRYDAAAVAAWALVTPPARFSLTEPADAVREWVEQNIFAPLAHAPALNADYRLFPLSGLLPPEGEELQAIDADEVYPVGSWRHGVDNAINVARYTYLREFIEPGAAPIYQRLATREVTVETRNIEGIDAVGEKDWTFSPITVREVGDETGGPLTATTQDEASAQLARQVTQGITDRYFEGVQEVEVGVRAIYPEIMDITVGQWLDVSLPWMPDYLTARRGLRRFMQVLGVRDEDLHRRVLRLEDGGPITDALLPPCIDSVDATVNRELLVTIAPTEMS